jgi:type I restriction enzyme M protein
MSDTTNLINKLWNYCNVLRDDGLSYGDYVEQLTFLLYLKMAHERTQPPWDQESTVPDGFDWPSLLSKDGLELASHYRDLLEHLGTHDGMIGIIFRKAQNRIQDPAKLRRLIVDLIDTENWLSLDADVKGDAYEGLLQKNAQDSKGGAGQYFTPRPVIEAMCRVMDPKPGMTISDPACGTGGFLLAAYNHVVENNPNMDRDEKEHLRFHALKGVELVDSVTRLCAMNLSLHGIGNEEFAPVRTDDSLRAHPGEYYDMVLANPPFGTKSAVKIITAGGETGKQDLTVERDDFWTSTSNKQLMFLQHIVSTLKVNGAAAVVLPDNVLFEGGSGETIRRKLMQECNLHTIVRLPTGLFYAQGVKANVIFFTKGSASANAHTKRVWFYDLRTNKKFTLKQRPLTIKDLEEFISLYKRDDINNREATWSEDNEEGRWRSYLLEDILARDKASLDILWLKDDNIIDMDNLPDPDVIADEIVTNLEEALSLMNELRQSLGEPSSE